MSEYVPPKKTALDHVKMRLRGTPYVEGDWKSPELTFGMFAGHPQILVWSEHPSELNKLDHRGKPLHKIPIKASTNINYLQAIFEDMTSMIGSSEPVSKILRTLTIPRDPNTNEPIRGNKVAQAKIIYGRNPEGYLFFEIRNEGRPVMSFPIRNDGWHEFDGDFVTDNKAKESDWIARGFLKQLSFVYSEVFVDSYDPDFKTVAQKKAAELAKELKAAGSAEGNWA